MKYITFKIIYLFFIILVIFENCAAYEAQSEEEKKIERIGDVLQITVVVSAFVPTILLDDSEGRTQFYKSLFTNLGITYSLKYIIPAARPEGNGDHSFPSGHTSAAFQSAAFIHKRYGLIYGIPAYIASSLVGYSRDEGDKHYVHDILAGAALGIACSFYFTTTYENTYLLPYINNNYYGISIHKDW